MILKNQPGIGTGEVYPFSITEPIKKSHAAEPFEKEERLGAAEPCLFGANIVPKRVSVCQALFQQFLEKLTEYSRG